jgi:hypothetical protein
MRIISKIVNVAAVSASMMVYVSNGRYSCIVIVIISVIVDDIVFTIVML